MLSEKNNDRRQVADVVAERIERLIVDGVLKAGQALPSERRLCEKLGISRSALREGLRVLRGRETQAKRSGAFGQALLLRVAHAALATAGATPVKPLKPPFFKWISSKEMAAGVTPLMRPACPSVSGRCFCSFCRTSMDRAGICR